MEWKPPDCGYYSGFGKPATRTGNPKPCSHGGIHSVALLYLSGCGALSVRLTFINVVEVAQRKHLPRVAFDNIPTRHDEDALNRVSTMPNPDKRRIARATPLMVSAVIASMAASSRQVRRRLFFFITVQALRSSLHYALILPEGRERGQNFAAPYRPWLACPPCPLRVHGPLRHPGARPAPPTSSRPPLGGFGRAVAPYGRAFLSATASRCRLPELGRVSSLRPKAATRQSVLAQ